MKTLLRLLLSAGLVLGAAALQAEPLDPATRQQRLDLALTQFDFATAQPLAEALLAAPAPSAEERALIYRWLFTRDDGAEVDRRTRAVLEPGASGVQAVDLLAAGRLALDLLQYERAEACFQRAQALSANKPEDQAAALKGLGQLAFKRLDFDTSITQLNASLALDPHPDALAAQAQTLIRLGRTDEAITAMHSAVQRNPFQVEAHYLLGNGYGRKNYSELAAAYGPRLSDAAARARQGSDAFDRGDYAGARAQAEAALQICPEYGRAHNLLTLALQMQRYGVDVHRADYERRFAAQALPVVPGIDKFVLNWARLSARQQKRVALSVAPWRAFIPVLVAGGSTFYIKPLHMKLSETPGLEGLKDQRINTDSRLWDDVRGAGGFATVTGSEDVEKTIFDSYNTVLHELSHQVHGVLSADQMREIQELYRRAKLRQEATRNGFLSRYAGGTVWEYFAEGINAFASPQRDAYDAREVVRERLARMDPDLQALVERFLAQTDVRASLPIALLNAGNDELEKGHVAPALRRFQQAVAAAPRDESVRVAELNGLSVAGASARVAPRATQLLRLHPSSGSAQTGAAEARWHAGRPLAAVTQALAAARPQVRAEDRHLVDQALGGYHLKQGDTASAIAACDAVLGYQSDNPEARWGKASALALAGRIDEAVALYEQAIRSRTGVVELRNDLARDLLRAGRLGPAREQLEAARLLDPRHPVTLALDAALALAGGNAEDALTQARAALAAGPWCDTARLVQAQALKALRRPAEAARALLPLRQRLARHTPPHYVYRQDMAAWVSVHELPAVERRWLDEILAGL